MNPRPLRSGGDRSDAIRVSSGGADGVPSGFGTVLEHEHTLQSSTSRSLHAVSRPHADTIDRTLRSQGNRLDYIMSLLKRRCDLLPCPARFDVMARFHRRMRTPASGAASTTPEPRDLVDLVAQHRDLLDRIRWLARPHARGDRGEALLAEAVRSHAHMIWWLTILLEEEAGGHAESFPANQISQRTEATTEAGWENEGGSFRRASRG